MTRRQNGFSLIELLIVVCIILVIAAIAIPNMLKARISANEASAVNSIRTITTAQLSYRIFYPASGYAASLDKLSPTSGIPDPDHADLLPASISTAPYQHSGYTFSSTGDAESFIAGAVPSNPGVTGVRSFCTDTPAAIYYSPTEVGCTPGTNLLQ